MNKYKGMKNIEKIKAQAHDKGFETSFTSWDEGGDWFYLRDLENRKIQIAVNCFGKFMVYKPNTELPIATERSVELDTEEWYEEILDLLYEPMS